MNLFGKRGVWSAVALALCVIVFAGGQALADCGGTDFGTSSHTFQQDLVDRVQSALDGIVSDAGTISTGNLSCQNSPRNRAYCLLRGSEFNCAAGTTYLCCLDASTISGGSCIANSFAAQGSSETRSQYQRVVTAHGGTVIAARDFRCQDMADATARSQRCVLGGCTGSNYCCTDAPATAPATGGGTTSRGAAVASDGCNQTAVTASDDPFTLLRQMDDIANNNAAPTSTWYCQCVTATTAANKCVTGGCRGGATQLCCIPNTGQPPPSSGVCTAAAGTSSGSSVGSGLRIVLPACITSHDASTAGKCALGDILNVGISFANFLLGLSGAILLGLFIWGAVYYIFYSYNPSMVSKGKDMIKNGLVGMLLIILAGTMVRFAKDSLTGGSTTSTPTAKTATTPATNSANVNCNCTCRNAGTGARTGGISSPSTDAAGCTSGCGDFCRSYCTPDVSTGICGATATESTEGTHTTTGGRSTSCQCQCYNATGGGRVALPDRRVTAARPDGCDSITCQDECGLSCPGFAPPGQTWSGTGTCL